MPIGLPKSQRARCFKMCSALGDAAKFEQLTSAQLVEAAAHIVPELSWTASKGGAGRVAVIGGSLEYTGAPYFAAMSALRAGVDLSHIYCDKSAGTPIKSYSGDLIVHPVLESTPEDKDTAGVLERVVKNVGQEMARFDGLLVGPGLGRDPLVMEACSKILCFAASQDIPIVLDADGLFILTAAIQAAEEASTTQKEFLAAMGSAFLTITPNRVEFNRLCNALGFTERGVGPEAFERAEELAASVGARIGTRVTIVVKGPKDILADGTSMLGCSTQGMRRRCGGTGDVLAGLLLAFKVWSHQATRQAREGGEEAGAGIAAGSKAETRTHLLGTWAACHVARTTAARAFAKHKRATLAADLLDEVGPTMEAIFPVDKDLNVDPWADWNSETDLR